MLIIEVKKNVSGRNMYSQKINKKQQEFWEHLNNVKRVNITL